MPQSRSLLDLRSASREGATRTYLTITISGSQSWESGGASSGRRGEPLSERLV